jgi:hypothetical protein
MLSETDQAIIAMAWTAQQTRDVGVVSSP